MNSLLTGIFAAVVVEFLRSRSIVDWLSESVVSPVQFASSGPPRHYIDPAGLAVVI